MILSYKKSGKCKRVLSEDFKFTITTACNGIIPFFIIKANHLLFHFYVRLQLLPTLYSNEAQVSQSVK